MRRTRPPAPRPTRAPRPSVQPLEGRLLFAAGDPDPTFGGDGIATFHLNNQDIAFDVAALPGGKVLAVGTTSPADGVSGRDFLIVRFNADGTVDTSFGNGGHVTTDFAGGGDVAHAVETLPDGRFIVVGHSDRDEFPLFDRWSVARYRADGSLDPTFSGDGTDLLAINNVDGAWDVKLQPDGKAVITGNAGGEFAVVRYNTDGTLDRSFDGDGIVLTPFNNFAQAMRLDVGPDGRIVAAGSYNRGSGSGNRGAVVRYLPDGRLDTSFSSDGRSFVADASGNPLLWGVKVQSDHKIVVLQDDFTVRRLKVGGGDDWTFGTQGVVRAPARATNERVFARDLARQADGKFVAGGMIFSEPIARTDAYVVRYTANGRVDTSFGDGGAARASDPGADGNPMFGIDLAADGKVVGAGDALKITGPFDATRDFAAYRFRGDTPEPPPPTDTWTVQAEDLERASGVVVSRGHAGFTGSGFVDFVADNGATAEWIVQDTPGAGIYTVDFRYANGSSSPRQLAFDPSPGHSAQLLSFAPTGSWSTWRTLRVEVTMLQGSPALPLFLSTTGQNGPNIDRIDVSYAPLPDETQNLQAENARLVGARVGSSNGGYTGTGYADFTNASGDFIEWRPGGESGQRRITFRYANGSSTNRALQLSLNGDVVTNSLPFAPTGSWSTWREVSMEVSFEDGPNILRLTSVGNNGPNIDVLRIAIVSD